MAEKKKRLRLRGVKQASKRQEDDIISRANAIADNPGILRPMCAGNCRKCAFDKPFKDITKIATYRNDEKGLMKFAERGFNNMVKAYAGTLSVAAAGKIPLLATALIAGERVPYVIRGSAPNGYLIGCQHHDDPKLRLMYYNDFIRAEKLHLYSWEDKRVCSNMPNMPDEYLYDTWWESPYEFPDDGIDCGHPGAVSLNIRIKSLDETIHICDQCAKPTSTLQYLISRMCATNVLDDFEVTVKHAYHSADDTGVVEIKDQELKEYMIGKITDKALIERVRNSKLGELSGGESLTLVIGDRNYGSDIDAFIGALEGTDTSKDLIRTFLGRKQVPIVIRSPRTADALQAMWDVDWFLLLELVTSPEFAQANYTEKPKQPVIEVLMKARRDYASKDVVASLPVFFKPGPVTRAADALAKAAKVGGEPMMADELTRCDLKDPKSRAVAAALFLGFGAELPLILSKENTDFTRFLVPFAKGLIDAEGQKYADAMNTLLMAQVCGEKV